MQLENKNAIISGGATGGAGAKLYAAEGAHVAIIDKNIEAANERVVEIEAAGGRAFAVKADVSKAAEVGAAAEVILKRFACSLVQ